MSLRYVYLRQSLFGKSLSFRKRDGFRQQHRAPAKVVCKSVQSMRALGNHARSLSSSSLACREYFRARDERGFRPSRLGSGGRHDRAGEAVVPVSTQVLSRYGRTHQGAAEALGLEQSHRHAAAQK